MPEPELIVSTHNLTKDYGTYRALNQINLAVPEGAIYGFIGANGAGKTTTIRILLGLISASSGHATVLGYSRGQLPCDPIADLAYLPDVPRISSWLTAKDALITFAQLSGVPSDIAATRADSLLELVGLHRTHGTVGGFSRGMTQRLGIASALIGSPRLLILDEPTSALDPMGRAEVLEIISSLAGKATVIFSSHLLGDVQQVCSHVGLLDRGKLLAQGRLEEILETIPATKSQLHITGEQDDLNTARELLSAALPGLSITEEKASLQDVYLQATTKELNQ
ncbi:ABC transporter ATP-binding protein [Trueperella sp. LYQ143]|uniref:ABC transporter ATP-binding protein n=1 Tax=unclassified Trueperella TaxID=2630174 RepID=UPI003983D174